MRLPDSIRTLREVPAAATAALVFGVNSTVFGAWFGRIPEVKANLSLDDGALGLALLGMPAGGIVAMPVVGWWVRRAGAGRATLASTLAFCAAIVGPALAVGFWSLLAALALLGLANGAMDVAMNARAEAVERETGRRIWSACHGWFSVGGVAGAGTGALAAAGEVPLAAHFAAVGGAAAALVLLRRRTLRDASEPPSGRASEPASGRAVAAAPPDAPAFALPRGPLLGLAVLAVCVLVGEGAMADWSAVYLRDTLGAGAGAAALGYAAFSAAMAAGRFLGDGWSTHWGPVLLVRAGAGLAAAGLALALVVPAPGVPARVAALVGFVGVGFGYANVVPVLFREAARAAPAAPGLALAAVMSAGYVGFLAGPPLIGLTAAAVGLRGALGGVAALAALAAVGARRLMPGAAGSIPHGSAAVAEGATHA